PNDGQQLHVKTRFDAATGAVFAETAYNDDFAHRVAFACASEAPRSSTADRASFIGRNGSLSLPAALGRTALSNRFGAGLDPCAALHIAVTIEPKASHTVVFLLGQGANEQEARDLIGRHGRVEYAEAALREVRAQWDRTLGAVQVHTPDDSFDVLM